LKLCTKKLEDIEIKRSTNHFKDNKMIFKKLIALWGNKKEITRDDVETYLNQIAKKSHYTANRYLNRIKALFNFGIEREWFTYNPAGKIKPYPVATRKKYIPPMEDIIKFLQQANEIDRCYLLMVIQTMARIREINRLKWEDIQEDYLTLYTRKSKNSNLEPRDIPLNEVLKELIKKIPKKGEYVFINPRTKTKYEYRDKFIKTLCLKAGVKPFMYHNLRHFGATLLSSGGTGTSDIQGLLGHSRASTTDLYLQSLKPGMVEAMKKLEIIS
jgi:integrase